MHQSPTKRYYPPTCRFLQLHIMFYPYIQTSPTCHIVVHWEQGIEGQLWGRMIFRYNISSNRNDSIFKEMVTLKSLIQKICSPPTPPLIGNFNMQFVFKKKPAASNSLHLILSVLSRFIEYASNFTIFYWPIGTDGTKSGKLLRKLALLPDWICTLTFETQVGLVAVFDSHNLNKGADGELSPIPNMYTLHSWLGMAVVLLFACQWVSGLLTFLFPGLRPALRAAYLPIHQFFGMAIFLGAVAAALMGIQEKAHWAMKTSYGQLPPEGVLVNVLGILLVVFAGLVIYLTSNGQFRRQASEDEVLLTDTVLE
ncbi:unnamed protein product, partial [Meganyctiphanes norvegica]